MVYYMQVSDRKPAGQRPVSAHTDSSGKQAREEKAGKKSQNHQAVAQERIRAKLIAISELSAAEVKKSLPSQSRDTKTSSHARSPSPKRRTHVCKVLNFVSKV